MRERSRRTWTYQASRLHPAASLIAIAILALNAGSATAQTPKEIKARSGIPVVIVNFLNAGPDCSSNPGPIAVPVIREKPANGVIQMQIVASDVAATGKCPARKIPTTALIYISKKDFIGSDTVQIEVETGNRTTSLSYKIVVQAPAERL